jgi:hypothetical protein
LIASNVEAGRLSFTTDSAAAIGCALDLDRVKRALRRPVVVDLRNIYNPADMAEKGFTYVSVGRG